MRVKLEVLPDRQFRVERERLRHVADAIARTHVAGFQRLPEQQRLAGARRQQAGQHFHRRRLAAAVRAEKAEDLAALDGEADAVDRGEVAEAAGEIARDDDRLAVDDAARRNLQRFVIAPLFSRQQGDERLLERGRAGFGLEFRRANRSPAPCRRSWPRAIRTVPLPPYRRSRRPRSCPALRERMRSISSQNCRRESGSTPVVGSSRIRRSGSWMRQQQSPSFCRMPPDSFFAGRSEKGASPVPSRSSPIFSSRCGTRLPEQAAEELDILPDAQVRVEILAQALRHVGDARTDRGPMRRASHVAAEDENGAGLDPPRAGDQAQQRRLADAVWPDESDHAAGRDVDRDVVQRDHIGHTTA